MSYVGFKTSVEKEKSKNFCFVNVRNERVCRHCGISIERGKECLTINPKYGSRYWVCDDCVSSIIEIIDTTRELDLVPFDDDGAWLAYSNYLDEIEGEFYKRSEENNGNKV